MIKKKAKVLGSGNNIVHLECPNCQKKFHVKHRSNRWHEWFYGECWTCGYNFMLRDTEFDYVQPNSPFFKLIYKYHPDEDYKKNKKISENNEEKKKGMLEEKYERNEKLKPWEKKELKKIVLKGE